MTALHVPSLGPGAGKTALCTDLAKRWQVLGKRVGFFKPISVAEEEIGEEFVDRDVETVKAVLGLEESEATLCPVAMTLSELNAAGENDIKGYIKRIVDANEQVSKGKDIVVSEGLGYLGFEGNALELSKSIIGALKAKTLIIARHEDTLSAENVVSTSKALGDAVIGVVINAVPESKLNSVKTALVPSLKEMGMKVAGVIPEDRTLFAFTVQDLLRELGGELVTSGTYDSQPLENIMVGALTLDSGLSYFNRKPNKLVVTRGNRADIHLAALETSTRCLVCTGGMKPMPRVISQAEQKGIPVVVVNEDTNATIAKLESIIPKVRFQQGEKLEKLSDLVEKHLDLKALNQALGL